MSTYSRTALADFVASKMNGSPKKVAQQVAAYLVETGHTSDLSSLERDVLTILDEQKGIVELTVTSAHALTAVEKKQVEKLVKSIHQDVKKIVINEQIDTDVIGGIRLEFPHQSLDLTVRSKLNQLRSLTS